MSNALAFLGRDMAVDLGTANTLVYVRGRGIVLNEPSVVALNTNTGQIVAVGVEAKRMIGRTPGNIVAIRPLKDGVIADFEIDRADAALLHPEGAPAPAPGQAPGRGCVPSGITGVEQRAVKEARSRGRRAPGAHHRGADGRGHRRRPAGHEATGNMVVDIGGGTTEVAVISSAASSPRSRSGWPATNWTTRSSSTARRSTRSCSASGPPRRSRWRSARPTRRRTSRTPRSAAGTWSPACPRRS